MGSNAGAPNLMNAPGPRDVFQSSAKLVGGLEHFLFFHILEIIIPTDNHQVAGFSVESTHFGGINEWLAKAKAWLWLQQLSLGGNSGWEHSCPCVAPEAVGPWSLSLGNFSGQSIRRTHPRYPCQPIQVPSWMGWGYNFGQKVTPKKIEHTSFSHISPIC